jgi:hypothetical protein
VTERKMLELRIDEVSGVDSPANLLDGFTVMKSRGAEAAQETLDAIGKPLADTDQPGLALPWKNSTNKFSGDATIDLLKD